MEPRRRKGWAAEAWLTVALLLLACGARPTSGLSVTVKGTECVQEYVMYGGDSVSGNFVVVENRFFWNSDGSGIELVVTSPRGNTVYSLEGTSGDKFNFTAPRAGMYKFCFHNPRATPLTVSFYIHVGHIPSKEQLARDEHLDPISVKLAELREALDAVTAEHKYLKARDNRHRHTKESTQRRLIMYTLAKYLALACASALQVFHIRRLFSKLVAYNRV